MSNSFENLTDEELIKRYKSYKGILTVASICYAVLIGLLIYVFITKGFSDKKPTYFIPFLILPLTISPTIINFNKVKSEVKARNLQ